MATGSCDVQGRATIGVLPLQKLADVDVVLAAQVFGLADQGLCAWRVGRSETCSWSLHTQTCVRGWSVARVATGRGSSSFINTKCAALAHLERLYVVPLCSFIHLDLSAARVAHIVLSRCAATEHYALQAVNRCTTLHVSWQRSDIKIKYRIVTCQRETERENTLGVCNQGPRTGPLMTRISALRPNVNASSLSCSTSI